MLREAGGLCRNVRLSVIQPLRPLLQSLFRVSNPALLLLACSASLASAQMMQEDLMRPGDGYLTRFSGTVQQPGPGGQPTTVIDLQGTVGSIVNLRSPRRPPRGEHWYDEPQRKPVTAVEVGQVFGVVLDDATPPNIYLSSTSAFGLHLMPGTQQWMPGQWGAGGGPGTIYRLSRESGYRPSIFGHVTLGGRPNTGAALGNMAFDRIHKVLFVSDLETGMIHGLRASDGAELGYFDHGVTGRGGFYDVENKSSGSLPAIGFDPRSGARIADCPSGAFERSPECWNLSPSGRRVWGLGVRHDVTRNETRLYYAVWSSPAFGNDAAWNATPDDDKRNSVWSVKLATNGSFDTSDIRREFLLPDFFIQTNDVNRAGFSQPVSDITFSDCGDKPVMLIAERGGMRNLGLSAENPFAFPSESRALRYELDTTGVWRPVGRYDVGYYDRKNEGQPFMRANCSGGIAFGPGYTSDWAVDLAKLDQYVWMTGDRLCSPEGPCHLFGVNPEVAAAGDAAQNVSGQVTQDGDDSQVHGAQGQAEGIFEEVMPAAAMAPYPAGEGSPYPATGPDQSYLIDADVNVDANGNLIEQELLRNDAAKIGDIAIYEICLPRQQFAQFQPPEPGAPPPILFGHDEQRSHFMVASHQVRMSHYRFGSHNPYWSHNRFRSHHVHWSHSRSGSHNPRWSHSRRGSHQIHLSKGWPPKGRHLVAHSSHTDKPRPPRPPVPPITNSGMPPHPPGVITNQGSTPPRGTPPAGPTVITNQGSSSTPPRQPDPQGTVTINSGTCSTAGGRTTCTDMSGHSCTVAAGSHCIPQTTSHQNLLSAPGRHNAAISRQSAGRQPSGTTTTHSGTTHPGTTTTHQGTTTTHKGTSTTNRGTSTTDRGTKSAHQGTSTRHRGTNTHRRSQGSQHAGRQRGGQTHVNRVGGHRQGQAHVNRSNFRQSNPGRGGMGGGGFHRSGGGGGGFNKRSDINLKEDIALLTRLDNGIGIYRFRYKGSDRTSYVGVMAQEVQQVVPDAVMRARDGYLRVSYERLGLDFMTWDAWKKRAGPR